jgi:hypothetical protein
LHIAVSHVKSADRSYGEYAATAGRFSDWDADVAHRIASLPKHPPWVLAEDGVGYRCARQPNLPRETFTQCKLVLPPILREVTSFCDTQRVRVIDWWAKPCGVRVGMPPREYVPQHRENISDPHGDF